MSRRNRRDVWIHFGKTLNGLNFFSGKTLTEKYFNLKTFSGKNYYLVVKYFIEKTAN